MTHTPRRSRALRASTLLAAALAIAFLLAPTAAQAQPGKTYRVTITNLTESQPITPPVVVTHRAGIHLFVPGEAPPPPLVPLAEDGDFAPLVEILEGIAQVHQVMVASDAPIPPGGSATVEIEARGRAVYLSAVGMLATTNDTFFGLDSYLLLGSHWRSSLEVPAWDAGSEEDNELCQFIPGPPCESPGERATENAEGFVHVSSGIDGIGDLPAELWSWNNPVVRIDVTRLPGARGGNGGGNGNS